MTTTQMSDTTPLSSLRQKSPKKNRACGRENTRMHSTTPPLPACLVWHGDPRALESCILSPRVAVLEAGILATALAPVLSWRGVA